MIFLPISLIVLLSFGFGVFLTFSRKALSPCESLVKALILIAFVGNIWLNICFLLYLIR